MSDKVKFTEPAELTNSSDVSPERHVLVEYDSPFSPHDITIRGGIIMEVKPEYLRFRRDGEDYWVMATDAFGRNPREVVKRCSDGTYRRVGQFDTAEVYGHA